MKVVRMLALSIGSLYPLGDIPGIHLCQRLYQPLGHSVVRRVKSMKSPSNLIRNLTRNLLACIGLYCVMMLFVVSMLNLILKG